MYLLRRLLCSHVTFSAGYHRGHPETRDCDFASIASGLSHIYTVYLSTCCSFNLFLALSICYQPVYSDFRSIYLPSDLPKLQIPFQRHLLTIQ